VQRKFAEPNPHDILVGHRADPILGKQRHRARARKAYYPQRCAQENLGQQSPAVHRAYAKNAAVTIPSLDEWEELVANKIIDINQVPKVA